MATASDVAVQGNVGLLVNCASGLRLLEASKTTRSRHESNGRGRDASLPSAPHRTARAAFPPTAHTSGDGDAF